MTTIKIMQLKTDKVEREIKTKHKLGSSPYNKLLDGLYKKVDFERFYILEQTEVKQ